MDKHSRERPAGQGNKIVCVCCVPPLVRSNESPRLKASARPLPPSVLFSDRAIYERRFLTGERLYSR